MKIYHFDNWLKNTQNMYEDEIMLGYIKADYSGEKIFSFMAELDDEFIEFCETNKLKPSWKPLYNIKEVKDFIKKYRKENKEQFAF